MSILKDVLSELFKMFVSDARLTATILAIVLGAAALIRTSLPPMLGGAFLLISCVAVLVRSVSREAQSRSADAAPGKRV